MDNTASPPPAAPAPPRGDGGSAFFDSVRRSGLARSQDRWIGGVAGGVAHRLGIDPLIVRGLFVVLALFGGLAIVAYGVGWALLPEAADGRIHLQEAFRGRFDAALAGAAAFVAVGIARPVAWLDAERWVPGWLIGLAWLGLVVTVIVLAVTAAGRAGRSAPPGALPPAGYGAPPGSPPGSAPTPYPTYAPPAAGGSIPGAAVPNPTPTPGWRPPPPAPRVPGPGSTTVAVVLALILFAGAAVLLALRAGAGIERPGLAFGGVALVVLGLATLISGLRGRRAGALAGIGVLVAVLAVPAAVATSLGPEGRRGLADGGVVAGDVVWSPATAVEAAKGFSYGVGEARVDLTEPDWTPSDAPTEVTVEAGAGSTTVVVPADVPLEVRAHVGAGQIRSVISGDWERSAVLRPGVDGGDATRADGRVERTEAQGTDVDVVLRSPAALDDPDGRLALIVTIDAGLGDVTIEEEN